MKLPPQIAIPASGDAITKEVKRLLRAAGVNGVVPTPREAILECAKLVESGDLDLRAYEESFRTKTLGFLHKAAGKVLGFLDFRRREVYVDPSIHPNRRNFVTFHEVTHQILDWQKVIYTEDEHLTLVPECRNIFESEANYGAAEILFQCEKFQEMARDYNTCIASVLHLANCFEASAHATIRRFVERHHRPCVALVLKPTRLVHDDGIRSYVICYAIASNPFLTNFGMPFRNRFINPGDEICDTVNAGQSGTVLLRDLNGVEHEYVVEPFDSGYSVFAMIYRPAAKRASVTARFRM